MYSYIDYHFREMDTLLMECDSVPDSELDCYKNETVKLESNGCSTSEERYYTCESLVKFKLARINMKIFLLLSKHIFFVWHVVCHLLRNIF